MDILSNKINITVAFCSLFILGIISFFAQIQLIAIIFVIVLLLFLLYKQKVHFGFIILLLLTFIAGFYISDFRVKEADSLYYFAPKNNVTIEGQVISILETNKADKTRFYLKAEKIKSPKAEKTNINSKVIVTLLEPKEVYSTIKIGDKVSLHGKLRLPSKATNPSEFSYANYLKTQNTFSTFFVESGNFKILSKPDKFGWKILQKINQQRDEIIQKHSLTLKSPYLELLGGVVFGDDAITPTDNLKESFKIAGLLHLLAASGLNVGLIFSIWFFIGKTFKLNYRINIITGSILIILYTCMTGFSPSILRATLMIEFVLLGKLIDREADNLALISFVCFLMLLYNPCWICSIGFQLSFLVTAGLIIFMPLLNNFFKDKLNKYFLFLFNSISVPLIAQICILPVQMYYFNTFSLYSIFANILVLPFITVVSFVGFISSILTLFKFLPDLIIITFDKILYPFLYVTVKISDFIANLPHSNVITIQPTILQIVLYYIFLLLLFLFIKIGKKKIMILCLTVLLLLFISFININDNKLHLTFFSVQNADSCLVKTPQNHYFIIDTGKKSFNNSYSQGEMIIAKYLLLKKVKKIDFVILSHLDNDHIGGTIGLLEKIKVKKIFVNSDIQKTETAKELFYYLKKNNIPYEIVNNNTTLYKEANLQVSAYLQKSLDENENSIINTIKYKNFDAVFMGDAGVTGFDTLNNITKIDVLKLGHHGAENTINKNIITKFKPKEIIISTGKNQYGHPHFSIINLLLENNVNYLRTDNKNTIEVISDGNIIKAQCFSTKYNKFKNCRD